MRENRPYGSEGGEAKAFPTPIKRRMDCFVGAPGKLARSSRWESGPGKG